MEKSGSAVTIIDGLDHICSQLIATRLTGKWSNQKDMGMAKNLRVQELNAPMREVGRALARIFGHTLYSGYFQECFEGYEIEEHSHIDSLPGHSNVVYGLLYTSNDGDSTLTLSGPDAQIERKKGRLVLVPEDRRHAVKASDGHNTMVRFVFVPRQPGDRAPACSELIKEMRPWMEISYA